MKFHPLMLLVVAEVILAFWLFTPKNYVYFDTYTDEFGWYIAHQNCALCFSSYRLGPYKTRKKAEQVFATIEAGGEVVE